MGRAKQELTATFIRERHAFNNDDSRVIIADATDGAMEQITLKGEADYLELKTGMKYVFFGIWKNHPTYGEQFWFENFREADVGKDRKSVLEYLAAIKLPGIGLQKARKLYDEFGEDTLEIMRENPELVAEKISMIGLPTARTAATKLKKSGKAENIKAELLGFLKEYRVRKKVIDELITRHGGKAVERIKEDPFMLLEYKGVGFSTADKIWCGLGYDVKDIRRQAYAMHYELSQSNDGDIWVQRPVLIRGLSKHVSGTNPRRDEAVKATLDMGLITEKNLRGVKWYADSRLAFYESECSRIVADCAMREAKWPDISDLPFSEHQMEQLKQSIGKHIGVFSGSPGTGKTYSISLLIRAIQEAGYTVIVLTPTGKAAVRAKEAFDKAGVACDAVTAYSYLGFQGDGFLGVEAEHDFIICDEWSMCDISLNYEVLRCMKSSTRVLFVGDIHQLPPVGPGAPYRDMIQSGIVPSGMLTEIRRNSGHIVECCALIRDEGRFMCSREVNVDEGHNLLHIETSSANESVEQVMAIYRESPFDVNEPLDLVWDVQVIAATNKLRKELNELLQDRLNPEGEQVHKTEFRVGDKVICTKNSEYLGQEWTGSQWVSLKEPGESEPTRYKVANGEQGEVLGYDKGKMIVRVLTPTRIISVPMSKPKDDDDGGSKTVWDLGYAITCHRSQGSEWMLSILIVDDAGSAKRIQTKNWLITGLSRSRVVGVVIGSKPTIRLVAKTEGLARKTFLREDIEYEYESIQFSERVREWSEDDFADLLEGI